MSQAILKRISNGQLPMHFTGRDLAQLKRLRDAGYLKLRVIDNRTAATVSELTPLGRAAIRYFGFEFGLRHCWTCQ